MKRPTRILTSIAALVSALAVTSAMGQTTRTWTNQNGGLITVGANWNPNGLPNGNNGLGDGFQDTAQWDGQTTGAVIVTNDVGNLPNTGFGTFGINLLMTPNQIGTVQFISTVAGGVAGQIGLNHFSNNSASAQMILGDGNSIQARLRLTGRPAGATHQYVNNSTAPTIIHGDINWQAGGGTAYTMVFSGSGNWDIRNSLRNDNGSGGTSIVKEGPGTITWTNGTWFTANDAINTVTINAGTVLLKSGNLIPGGGGNAVTINDGLLAFDATTESGTIARTIAGTSPGVFEVRSGTLTLSSGNSTFSGNINLTGGSVFVSGTETEGVSGPLGQFGTISFTGGTLGFTVNNVWDYSARFNHAAAGQAYRFDSGGQTVPMTNNFSSSGGTLTKVGAGVIILGGTSSYGGLTTVSAGKLWFSGPKTGTGNITVSDGTSLGVTATASQVTPATLTLGTGTSIDFENVNSLSTAPLAPGTISAAGPVTINVNSGPLSPGNTYRLLSWSSGSAPAVVLDTLNGFIGTLTTNGNNIDLVVTATAFKWTGITDGSWDQTTGNNWQQNGAPVVFANGGPTLFDDTSARTNITINAAVLPTTVSVSSTNPYSIASSGANNLGGSAKLTKSSSGSLTLSGGANTYSGATTVSGGTLSIGSIANGGAASDIGSSTSGAGNLVINGGTLQYTGAGADSDRLFTIGTAGGGLDGSGTGSLNLTNTGALGYVGNGPRNFTLSGAVDTVNKLAAPIANNGGSTAVTKNGQGKWILTGSSTYSGVTTIANGVLQIGEGFGTGAPGAGNIAVSGGANLAFNRTNSITVGGIISGGGSVTNNGTGTVILTADSTYTGGTTINAGTLQVGNGGATGKLAGNGQIMNNGTLIFNSTGDLTLTANIGGTGQLIKRGTGLLVLRGGAAYTYSGGTTIDTGSRLQIFSGNEATFTGAGNITLVASNSSLITVRQDNAVGILSQNIVGPGSVTKEANNSNSGDVTLSGTNTYTGGTFIRAGGILLGDQLNPINGSITGNVTFANSTVSTEPDRFLTIQRPDDFTFFGNIIGGVTNVGNGAGQVNPGNAGRLIMNGSGTVTLTGNNTYPAGTTINSGTLQVGNGGASGSIGNGNVVINGFLIWNRSADLTYPGVPSGAGTMYKYGTGTVTLTTTNFSNFSGSIFITNGTLAFAGVSANNTNSLLGSIDLNGGTLSPGLGQCQTLETGAALFLNSGTVVAYLNTSLAQSNSFYNALSGIAYTSGTLRLINAGPALQVGQKFTIFNQPIPGGATMSIVSPGHTFVNNLEADGSVTVASVQPAPVLTSWVTGTNLNFSWPAAWQGGVRLQAQTNTLAVGISNNWFNVPGTESVNTFTTPINRANQTVFYRLRNP